MTFSSVTHGCSLLSALHNIVHRVPVYISIARIYYKIEELVGTCWKGTE